MAKVALRLVSPATENRTVARATPVRRPNSELRTREHLTPAEVDALIEAVKKNRYGHRDATMILMAYRHGFRPSALVDLRWDQIDFAGSRPHVRRATPGPTATPPLQGLRGVGQAPGGKPPPWRRPSGNPRVPISRYAAAAIGERDGAFGKAIGGGRSEDADDGGSSNPQCESSNPVYRRGSTVARTSRATRRP